MMLRKQLMVTLSGKRDGTPAVVEFAENFDQEVVNKRLKLGESVVDTTQPMLSKVAKTVTAAVAQSNDKEKRELALRELSRFEFGPIRSCSMVVATSAREEVVGRQELKNLEKERKETLRAIEKLKQEVEEAKTLPRDEIEACAETCNSLPSKPQYELKLKKLTDDINQLKKQREELKATLEKRKETLVKVAQVLDEFYRESTKETETDQ